MNEYDDGFFVTKHIPIEEFGKTLDYRFSQFKKVLMLDMDEVFSAKKKERISQLEESNLKVMEEANKLRVDHFAHLNSLGMVDLV